MKIDVDKIADRTVARVITHYQDNPKADPEEYIKRGIRFLAEDIKKAIKDTQGVENGNRKNNR